MRLLLVAIPALIVIVGCKQTAAPVVFPRGNYDPDAMTQAAMKEFDRNGDGSLGPDELEYCPSLKAALHGIDKNKDGAISEDELRDRFRAYKAIAAGSIHVGISFKLNGNPLEDAAVTFVPEQFMCGAIHEATGKTDEQGRVKVFFANGEEYLGLQPGLYRVKVSKMDAEGHELIQAQYNTKTTLGIEVFGGDRGRSKYEFQLTAQ